MVKKIRWTRKAEKNYSKIISYLKAEWSDRTAKHFDDKVNRKLLILQDFPFVAQKSIISPGYHKYIITKYNSIYYRIKNNEIIILNIYDNRQDPKKMKF